MKCVTVIIISLLLVVLPALSSGKTTIKSGEIWKDNRGEHINAHGGGVLKHGNTYYWYGEHKGEKSSAAFVGVTCYSSKNLRDWRYEGVALSVVDEKGHDLESGCTLERPKVIYNKVTKKFVMWFHLELKGEGYWQARYGVAVSDSPKGPFKFIRSDRANAGYYPLDFDKDDMAVLDTLNADNYKEWWTPTWRDAIKKGLFLKRDMKARTLEGHNLPAGQMSRDMTLFVDTDGRAYHIFSSEDNLTLHIAELSDDYLSHTGRYIRVAPGGQNEAPAVFRHGNTYWMITSGCTGWDPNEARMFSAPSIWGPWKQHPNPCRGPKANITFGGQSTFVLPTDDGKYIFMADIWRPKHPIDARYIWLPIDFDKDGVPVINWRDEW